MAQLNLYVPDEIANQLRSEAAAQGKSLSKLVLDKYILAVEPTRPFGAAFLEKLSALGPMPEDFVAPDRTQMQPEPAWTFDDLPA